MNSLVRDPEYIPIVVAGVYSRVDLVTHRRESAPFNIIISDYYFK